MRFLKTSLISYLMIIMLVLNFIAPAMAQVNIQQEEQQLLTSGLRAEAFSAYLEENETEVENAYTDVSHITDQEFFGEWDVENQEWKTVGKLNYNYSPGLAEVERLVKLNSYSMAKDALYDYYKNRTSIPRADFDGNISWHGNILWMKDAYYFSENAVAVTNIDNTSDEYKEYTIDLMGTVKGGVFLLSSINKTQDIIEIASRETEYSPRLLIKKSDGSEITLEPSKDTYIRAFDPEENYSYDNYGHSEKLYIKDSYYDYGNGTYSPISSDTRRTYIAFDATKIPSDAVRMYLTMDGYIFIAKITPVDDTNTIGETYITSEYTYVYQTPAIPVATMSKPIYGGLYLTGNYEYQNTDGIPEGDSEYKWYVSNTLLGEYSIIEDENEINFEHSAIYDGKYIKFSVTPKDFEGVTGETVVSTPVHITYEKPQTFDGENVMKEHIDTSQIKGGYTQISADPTDSTNKVLELTRTSKQNDQMTKVLYHVPEYKGASGMIIEADVYASTSLNGTWEMFYICDASANSHGYKLWHSSTNLYTRGGAAYINGEWKDDSSSIVSTKFTKNTWHTFRVVLDYTSKMMVEARFDGEVVQTNLPFRYNVASTNVITSYIQNGTTGTVYMDNLTFTPIYNAENMAKADAEAIELGVDLNGVISNIKLPDKGSVNGSEIVWSSSDESLINTRGKVTRPASSEGNKNVTLTAHIINGSDYFEREFDITVMRILTDSEIVELDAQKLNEYDRMMTNTDIAFPSRGVYGATYTWFSLNDTIIDNKGNVTQDDVKRDVQFEVTITKGRYSETKNIVITVAPVYGDNLIVNGGLSSSSAKAKNPVSNVMDDDYTTYWSNLDSDTSPFIIMDMGKVKMVNKMYIADSSKTIKSVRLSASANKTSWEDINITQNVGGDNINVVEFDEIEARYIRAYIDSDTTLSVNELALFYIQTDENKVAEGINDITLPVTGSITSNFEVITRLADGTVVNWTSSDTSVIKFNDSTAQVIRAAVDKSVILTATAVSGGVSAQKKFTVVVKGTGSNESGGMQGAIGGSPMAGGVSATGSENAVVTPQAPQGVFKDIDVVPWAVDAINRLTAIGVVNGTTDTTFTPMANVTREEFAALIHRSFGFEKIEINGEFSDVAQTDWYYDSVMQLSSMGIILGSGAGNFGVGSAITRQDMAVLICRAAQSAGAEFDGESIEFADSSSIDEYAKASVDLLSAAKIINGVGDGRFDPHGIATRAEAAVILVRVIDYIN